MNSVGYGIIPYDMVDCLPHVKEIAGSLRVFTLIRPHYEHPRSTP